jgi:iron(III) transport system ATP-binding protein
MPEELVVEGLEKVYPEGSRALGGVSFSVEPGAFMVLLGPSGSGKTTLMRAVAGIERASAGTISIGSKLVAGPGHHVPPERRELAMVFQDYALWPHLRVRDNVAYALRRRHLGKDESARRTSEMITRVGLSHLSHRFPGELSGGEQQRVALARALVGDTGLLLCDEPLSNLDADLRERMRVQISSLVREAGTTAIYITHDQQEAFALADQIGVLELGHLVQMGTPEDVYARPATSFVARFTGLAVELDVVVDGPAPAGRYRVVPRGLRSRLPLFARSETVLPTGEQALLTVRPSAVRVLETSDERCQLSGLVADVAFRGRNYELAVDLVDGRRVGGIHAERRMTRGEPVGLTFDPEGCHLFAGESGEGESTASAEEIGFESPSIEDGGTIPSSPLFGSVAR